MAGAADPADTSGTWRWLLADVNDNVATHLSDSAEVLEQAAFDPYGRPEKGGSSQPDNTKKGSTRASRGPSPTRSPQRWCSGPRLYDPATTRFTTPDTFVAGQLDLTLATDALTGNRYLFAAANPVAFFLRRRVTGQGPGVGAPRAGPVAGDRRPDTSLPGSDAGPRRGRSRHPVPVQTRAVAPRWVKGGA